MSTRAVAAAAACVAALGAGAAAARAQGAIGPGAIVAVVRDPAGRPLAGALVVADGAVSRSATTGPTGIVTLLALPLGGYVVRVSRVGYAALSASADVATGGARPVSLDLRLAPVSLAGLAGLAGAASAAGTASAATDGPAPDPYVEHALANAPGVDLVPAPGGGAAAALSGTTPLESRVELDGMPLPQGTGGLGTLEQRSALALAGVEIARGPLAPARTAQNAIGGVIDLRTASLPGGAAGAAIGYDSSFGAFQRLWYARGVGGLGVATTLVTGGGGSRAQVVKATYAVSQATTISYAGYGAQSDAALGGAALRATAPAQSLGFVSRVGEGRIEARVYDAVERIAVVGEAGPPSSDARVHGLQASWTIPAGEDQLALGYDLRRFDALGAGAPATSARYATVTARAELQVAPRARLSLGDSYGGGTALARRHDPDAELVLRPTSRLALSAGVASAFATARDPALAPETSFGYRLSAEQRLGAGDRAWAAAYALRRRDAFASLSEGSSRGVELGFERAAAPGRLGALAFVDLDRAYAFGAVQPAGRDLEAAPEIAGAQLAGDASAKGRLALSFGVSGSSRASVGATWFGAGNAFGPRGFALADAGLDVRVLHAFAMRFGLENAFGHPVEDAAFARAFAPHELTFSFGPDPAAP